MYMSAFVMHDTFYEVWIIAQFSGSGKQLVKVLFTSCTSENKIKKGLYRTIIVTLAILICMADTHPLNGKLYFGKALTKPPVMPFP